MRSRDGAVAPPQTARMMRRRVGSARALWTMATPWRSSGGAVMVAMVERMRAGLGTRASWGAANETTSVYISKR